jgi:hypothetical protein
VTTAAVLRHVRQRREELKSELALFASVEAGLRTERSSSPGLPYWLLTIRQGILVDEALLEWCDDAERELERLQDAR